MAEVTKKTVKIEAKTACFINKEACFTGTKDNVELPVGDIRMAILQNATVHENDTLLTLDNYNLDSSEDDEEETEEPPEKPSALSTGDLTITSNSIKCNKSLGENVMVVCTKNTQSEITATSLSPYTEYDVYVKATNSAGSTLSDKLTVRTKDTDPTKPAKLSTSNLTIESTQVTCTKSLNSNEKMVVYADGSTTDKKGEGAKGVPVTGLTATTAYDVYVVATNRDNKSVLSDKLDITTI